jgi:hypothetical protein
MFVASFADVENEADGAVTDLYTNVHNARPYRPACLASEKEQDVT